MTKNTKATVDFLTPRQSTFLKAYSDPASPSFGNCYQSAKTAGYADLTARNLMHLQPAWLSEKIGQIGNVIEPDDIMRELTAIINSVTEPTIVRLKAIEMTMKAYSMMVQRRERMTEKVSINIDLTGGD